MYLAPFVLNCSFLAIKPGYEYVPYLKDASSSFCVDGWTGCGKVGESLHLVA